MNPQQLKTLSFKRSHFVTHLPVDYRYTRSHAWMAVREGGHLRIGLTKFAARMLGEMVDHGFAVGPGEAVAPGQVLGWIEGFKAISDLIGVAPGQFVSGNSALQHHIALVTEATYTDGWLYEMDGQLPEGSLSVEEYASFLGATIDKLLENQEASADGSSLTAPA